MYSLELGLSSNAVEKPNQEEEEAKTEENKEDECD